MSISNFSTIHSRQSIVTMHRRFSYLASFLAFSFSFSVAAPLVAYGDILIPRASEAVASGKRALNLYKGVCDELEPTYREMDPSVVLHRIPKNSKGGDFSYKCSFNFSLLDVWILEVLIGL